MMQDLEIRPDGLSPWKVRGPWYYALKVAGDVIDEGHSERVVVPALRVELRAKPLSSEHAADARGYLIQRCSKHGAPATHTLCSFECGCTEPVR